MPKIEVYQKALFSYLGKSYRDDELEAVLPAAKAELDEPVNEDGIVKIELNDTNRPDLWSAAGLARLIRRYQGGAAPVYDFFSKSGDIKDSADRIVEVDSSVRDIRPYIVAFVAHGKAIDTAGLNDIIQTQEKLCWNFGQKRRAIAMGLYRADMMRFPVHYRGVDPVGTRFVPLGMQEELNLMEINERHPKGREYGHIAAGNPLFPLLTDSRGEVLSYPPVINSARIGAVEEGVDNLFVEFTGTEFRSLILAASIVACDMADAGFRIQPVRIEYPDETEFGRSLTTPYYFQEIQKAEISHINKLLGTALSQHEIQTALQRMGNSVSIQKEVVHLSPAEYRNDFLHAVDIVEDVMIGRGMDSFKPELPADFTIGRLLPSEEFMRKVRNIMVGLGFQEMIFNYLGSAKDYLYRMHPRTQEIQAELGDNQCLEEKIFDDSIVQILNPMSENHEFVRNSILPGLLSAESGSGNAAYPHKIYEVGKTARLDAAENYGARSINTLGFIVANNDAGFNLVSSQLASLFYYLDLKFELGESEDQRFIDGRCADLLVNGRPVGVFGELHPGVLQNWGIDVPLCACEIDLDRVMIE